MKRLLVFLFVLCLCKAVSAGMILKEKNTGKYLVGWYQSYYTKGLLLKNAVNCKVDITNLEEQEITDKEWSEIWDEYVLVPLKKEKAAQKIKIDMLKLKLKRLGFTDEELELLKFKGE